MNFKEYFEELNLYPDATPEEIKLAYYRLSKLHHPDVAGGDSEKFKRISHAFKVLTDPIYRYKEEDSKEPIHITCQLTLEQYLFGCQITHNIHHRILCNSICDNAETEIKLITILDVIPPKTISFPLERYFYALDFGIVRKDVKITYQLREHPRYKLKSGGLVAEEFFDLYDCLKGANIVVPTLFGDMLIQIPASVKQGQLIEVVNHPVLPMYVKVAGYKLPTFEELKEKIKNDTE